MSDLQQALYLIADEMRGMASIGSHFANNVYEVERAHRIMELAVQVAALAEDRVPEAVREIFNDEPWRRYSPAIGVEAIVFNPVGELLLIRRRDDQTWALPGGVAEIGQTLPASALKELWEEAGLRGAVKRLLGLFDNRLCGGRSKVHLTIFDFLVECQDWTPSTGLETLEARFFPRNQIPGNLHTGHPVRISKCLEFADSGETYFDPAQSYDAVMPMHQRPES